MLILAQKHALAYMDIPDGEHHYTSIFARKATYSNSYVSKDFSESEIDLIINDLKNEAFDFMRDMKEFKEFEKLLKLNY